MLSIDKIIEEISKKSGQPEQEIKKMIEEKQDELSGLVSPEGAAYIVGNELGVSLLKETARKLKVKNIVSGMRSVDVAGRVVQIFDKRDFEKNGKRGSVKNVIIGDETGTIRFSLWNDDIQVFDGMNINEGDVIEISNGFVREDNRGNCELRLTKTGKVEKLEDIKIEVPESAEIKQDFEKVKNKSVYDFREGEYNQTRASLIQLFKRNPFFEICPQCEGRLEKKADNWTCKDHGAVEPKYRMVLSGIIDDGSGNIRAVFFGDVAERLLGKGAEELKKKFSEDVLSMYENINVVGKEFLMTGRVKFSQFSEKLEFVVNEVGEVDVKKEMNDLLSKFTASGTG
ncbi:MAG: DUF2240 family protein [Candidatus Aenigmarchaeota archaeon]|nr:DUF2240 family protein [Candidatus Aenigmarchaeota archaeon]